MEPEHKEIYDEIAGLRRRLARQGGRLETLRLTVQNERGLAANLAQIIAENQALIAGQRAAIEALRGWIQERDDGVSNLGMRVAKLEDGGCNASFLRDDVLRHQIAATRAQAEKDRTWTRDLIATWRKELGHRIDALETASTKGERVERVERQASDIGLQRQVQENLAVADRRFHDRNERLNNYQSRINRLEVDADKRARFRAIHPPVTEEDNDD